MNGDGECPISISNLNDFEFCPVSIYFHNMYYDVERMEYQDKPQIDGTHAHETIDRQHYSTSRNVLQGAAVYSEELGLFGKIDLYYRDSFLLVERKKHVNKIYRGNIFQLYAQCYCLREMGYEVAELAIRSSDDNKTYPIPLPEDDIATRDDFLALLDTMRSFQMSAYVQTSVEKCRNCIYSPACDRTLDA